jgi:phytoene dehydrogenase-like protein
MTDKSVIVIGAGFAGLTAAAIMAAKGYRVDVFEKIPRQAAVLVS